ncbi:hypothetical protein [Biformimicrobium ophioploci]|uniref:Uncharacterized protein n=1 Tax=Biformimicrobium ophioploci TaxID=3036711 RepID=A0ABQ6M3A4_9GAMM|nr:hypothetical protein [Microbulbifer sp. NKW57]GMG88777.1 hypothetical protein MNKW57_30980 [Microbulbifer sp. NKW57]
MRNSITKILAASLVFAAVSADAKPNKEKQLPPGLEKQLERTGELPPGWEKKLIVGEYLDYEIYSRAGVIVPVGKDGAVTVQIEGRVVRLVQATREIIEILR